MGACMAFEKFSSSTQEIPGLVCQKHGPYTGTRWRFGATSEWRESTYCPTCAEEEQREREAEERRQIEQERVARAIAALEIPARFRGKSLDNFSAETAEQRTSLAAASEYVAGFAQFRRIGRGLVLLGPVGTGKTHLACGILDGIARAGHSGLYCTVSGLIRRLRATWHRQYSDSETESELIQKLSEVRLLVLDEVGVQYGTDSERTQLFEVLNNRYNTVLPTILISNLNIEGVSQYLGERALDRMREGGGRVVVFGGASWRQRAVVDPPETTGRRAANAAVETATTRAIQ